MVQEADEVCFSGHGVRLVEKTGGFVREYRTEAGEAQPRRRSAESTDIPSPYMRSLPRDSCPHLAFHVRQCKSGQMFNVQNSVLWKVYREL